MMTRMPHRYDKCPVVAARWIGPGTVDLVNGVSKGARVFSWGQRRREEREANDARAEAQHWYERLGGQLTNLSSDDPVARQALADAGERYNAAGGQLRTATTAAQFRYARESSLEGLAYIRAARTAMGIDPGPPLPPLYGQRQAGAIREPRQVEVQGHQYRAAPAAGPQTPYYHPGGYVSGRPIPQGYYSEPWWKTALVAGAWGVGSVLVFDALLSGFDGWGHGGYDQGYDQGFEAGADYADSNDQGDQGSNAQGDDSGYDSGHDSGYGAAQDDGTDYAAGGDAGDFGGGDFGGDFGGGDFGGGDF
jgi:hypothetical protein